MRGWIGRSAGYYQAFGRIFFNVEQETARSTD
jgi:hypothetical protein